MNETTAEMSPAMGGRGVIEGAFALLEAMAQGEEAGLTQLASASGLPKATAYRLLNQLVNQGAVQRRSGRYRLGPRVYRLGQIWQPAQLLRAASHQPMRQLTASVERGSFSLAVTDRGDPMLVGAVGREIEEAFPMRAGVLLPPGTAAEQILALSMPEPRVPDGFTRSDWFRLIGAAKDRGLAYDLDMRRYSVACVAAPVRGPGGEVVAALAATTFEAQRIPLLAEAVRRTAGVVTTNLTRLLRSDRGLSL